MHKNLLKNKNYMLLVIGNFISLLGSNIQQFVLSLYVLSITGSATIFASMLAISILPRILLSPIAGVFGDWFDSKKSIVILNIFNALLLFGFATIIFNQNDASIGIIYLLVILLEITEIFFHSAMSVVLPRTVNKDSYLEANSFRVMLISFGQLMGPIFGAILYASFGLLIAVLINATSFLLSAISEMFIHIPKLEKNKDRQKKSVSTFKKDFVEGLKLIRNSKIMRVIISIAVIVNFSIAPLFSVGLIFLIKEVLLQSDFRLGLLQTALSLSTILTPILLTKSLKRMKFGEGLIKLFFILGILIILISVSIHPNLFSIYNGTISYGLVLFICFLIGFCVTAINISAQTVLQQTVPIEYMGRVSTTLGLFVTISVPIGQMLFGYLYDIINPGIVVIVNGSIILLAVLIYYRKMKAIDGNEKDIPNIKNMSESRVMLDEI